MQRFKSQTAAANGVQVMFASVRGMHLRALLVTGLIAITSVSVIQCVYAQSDAANQWTWMGGSSSIPWPARGQSGVYGTLGTPAAGNIPGSRSSAATWTDTSGNLWLFGGDGYDASGNSGDLNDLWEFNPSTNQWAWMGGSSTMGSAWGQFGVYGTLGTPAAENIPGARDSAATWTDSKGHFWLYGGRGNSADYGPDLWLNDLWEFDPSTREWTWMGGDSSTGGLDSLPGVYGTLGTPATGNNPGSRESAVSWTDNKGNLWLFGGDNAGVFLNDLWEYNPSTNEWAWMGGSSTTPVSCTPADCSSSGIYGELGTPAAGNNPGARFWASSWTDSKGNFWLFGGYGYDSVANLGELNDLWEFNPSTNEWTWISGSSTVPGFNEGGQPGVYGTLGTPAAGNVPGGRDSATSWTDRSGNLWLFGGNGNVILNDLWEFSPSTSEWTWMGGSSVFDNSSFGAFGTLGDPAEGNMPGSCYSPSTWTDSTGNFWLFGGEGPLPVDGEWFLFSLNDFWKYQPSVTPSFTNAPAPTFSVAAGTYTSTQTVAISDAAAGATIYYTTDGSTPTINSNTYTGPLTVSSYSTTETINAMAVAANYFNSAVASATYVIDLPSSSGTVTTIASSLNPSNLGEYVTFTATVYPVSSAATPAGTVQLSVGTSPLGPPVALNSSGLATYTTAALFADGESITAAYIPGSGSPFAASTSSPLQQYVAGACAGGSATTLTSSQNPSNTGQSVSFTATVVATVFPLCMTGGGPPLNSGTYAPSGIYGTVQFYLNGTAMGAQIPVDGGSSSGVATYSTSTLPAGTNAITASFIEGNGYVGSSTSNTVNQVVDASASNPSFTIAPSSAALSITQGGSGTDIITVTDLNGFSGTVGLSVSGLPSGVGAGFSPGPSTGTSALALTASSTAATGTFPITVTGTSDGLTESITIALTVNAPASFTVAAQAAALSITQGGSGADTIAVNGSDGFSGSVTLAASGLPADVTTSFGTNPTTGTSVLTLAAGSTAAPGIYTVTVTGTSTVTAESATTTIQFAVDSAGASAPPFGASAATVAAGSTAAYPITLPSNVTGASVACMSLPAEATCSYSSTTNAVTISTSSTTPAGTYQVTVVFTETVAATAGAGILLPIGLLPLLFLRRKLAARGIWTVVCLGLILLAATVLDTGCSGAQSTANSPPSTYQITSSATVSLTVQ
ncbi:MAG TPA: kelch repeat-containing protein [Terracidiphilus sp.]|nr:kelch repeat-containing protein [Terracidiphilus sp.]